MLAGRQFVCVSVSARQLIIVLKGDCRLASSHLEICVSLFQLATVVFKRNFHECAARLHACAS